MNYAYLPYGSSILSTGHSISEHCQSFTSATERLRYSQFSSASISAVLELKSTLFLFFLQFMLKPTTPLIYTGLSELIIETQNSGTWLKNRQEECFPSCWLPKRKYFLSKYAHMTYNLGPAKGMKPRIPMYQKATGPSYCQTSFSQVSGLFHTESR